MAIAKKMSTAGAAARLSKTARRKGTTLYRMCSATLAKQTWQPFAIIGGAFAAMYFTGFCTSPQQAFLATY
jgi:hypothetical protein